MDKSKIDLGKSFEKMMRDPSLIHKIQDNLIALRSNSIMGLSIRKSAVENIQGCIDSIINAYSDNPYSVSQLVGEPTMKMIEEFTGIELPFVSERPANAITQDEINDSFKSIKKSSVLTEEELKALDEECTDDPDRRYHR